MGSGVRTDLLVEGTVITVDAERRVVDNGSIAVDDGAIVDIGTAEALRRAWTPDDVIGGPDAIVTPGMVNTHQHLTGDRLLRSAIPDDLPPGESIFSWVVPAHAAHEPEDDEVSATLGLLEALGNGITTTVEAGTVAHPDSVAAAFAATGARGTLGTWGWDVGDAPYAAPAGDVLERQRAVIERIASAPLVEGWVTLVGHDLMSDELVVGASALARELGTGLTFHLSPTASDPEAYLARTGERPLVHLSDLGVLGDHVLVAHAVHVDAAELDALVDTGAAVAYCPWAYLRLGQGVTTVGRHIEMVGRGVPVGLGCDAENAADAVDMVRTVALAVGLAKDMAVDPTGFGAHEGFELATIGGARAIGMADRIGSIEVGKRADLVVHDTSAVHWTPRSADPVLQLVWSSDGRSVNDVVVDGEVVIRDGRSPRVDLDALRSEATERSRSLLARAGIEVPAKWPR